MAHMSARSINTKDRSFRTSTETRKVVRASIPLGAQREIFRRFGQTAFRLAANLSRAIDHAPRRRFDTLKDDSAVACRGIGVIAMVTMPPTIRATADRTGFTATFMTCDRAIDAQGSVRLREG